VTVTTARSDSAAISFSTTPPSRVAQQPTVDQGFHTGEASRSHFDKPDSAALLWTSDQPDAKTFTCRHSTKQKFVFPEKFEPAISASKRPKTHAIDRATIGTGISFSITHNKTKATTGSCDRLASVGPTGVA